MTPSAVYRLLYFRYSTVENKQAYKKITSTYDDNIMGKVGLAIYEYHHGNHMIYELSPEAEEAYEDIVQKYNDQFNLKWMSSSQSDLDASERSEIAVRTKAPELIGRLSILLWIYTNGTS